MPFIVSRAWHGVIVAIAYVITAEFSLLVATHAGTASPIWPPAGIAVAALFAWGYGMVPWIVIGAIIGNGINALRGGSGVMDATVLSTWIAFGNTLGALTAAIILRSCSFQRSFARVRDVWILIGAGLAAALLAAGNGSAALYLYVKVPFESCPGIFGTWVLGDTLGIIGLAPVLLITEQLPVRLRSLLIPGLSCIATALVVGFDPLGLSRYTPTAYLAMVPVIWLGLCGGARAAACGWLMMACILVSSTLLGYGPLNATTYAAPLPALACFLVVSGLLAQHVVVYATQWQRMVREARAHAAADARFRILFELSSDAHLVFDDRGISDCNQATVRLLGCSSKYDILGAHPATLSPEFQPDGRRSLEKCVEMDAIAHRDGIHRFEWQHQRSDGSTFPAEVTLTPVEWAGQIALLVVWHDLTDHKRTELAMSHARDEAEAGNRTKNQFLATMSHEFRTPLHGVLGMANMLQTEETDPTRREALSTITTCADHLMVLINDILDLSRIEADAMPIESAALDPKKLASDTLAMVAPAANAKHLALHLRVMNELPPLILGDAARIRQILLNLLSNAVKFTDHGSISLELHWTDNWATWTVRDTGVGIRPEILPQLFRPFSQGDASMSRRHEGTGLGLSISKRLAERQGGTLEVASAPLAGSTFTCRLPAEVVPAVR